MATEDASVWNSFIQSLDVDPDKAKNIEQLPETQKRQLIESYVSLSASSIVTYTVDCKNLQTLCLSLCDPY